METINSKMLFSAYLFGANEVMKNKNLLNKINVFPVPDGDTGSNLFSTMNAIIKEAQAYESVKKTLKSIADSALKGARGNSGIIFAQYLYGLAMESVNESSFTKNSFIHASQKAVRYAYEAIAEPVEGTIITVIRDWAEILNQLESKSKDFFELFNKAYIELEKSVKNTTQQLKILKQNGVVDSGAKGFAYFIKGFIDCIHSLKDGKEIPLPLKATDEITLDEPLHVAMNIKERYCAEATIEGSSINSRELQSMLSPLGSSLLVGINDKIAKIHIHTDNPLDFFNKIGKVAKIQHQKVDDMKMQSAVVENRLSDIALVTDSIADLPADFIDHHQIHVLPLNLLMDDVNYLDKISIDQERVLDYMESHPDLPTSSQPDYRTIENLFSFLSSYYKYVLVVTVSKQLSGTYSIVNKIANDFRDKFIKIHVLDSKLNSGAQGLLVKRCAEYIAQGLKLDQIVSKAEETINKCSIMVSVMSIDNMVKAGRLSTKAGKIAKILKLKPIVTLDKSGKGTLGGIAFSAQGSLKKVIKKITKGSPVEEYSIVHVNNLDGVNQFLPVLEKAIGKKPSYVEKVSSITSISAGQGAIAIAYILS